MGFEEPIRFLTESDLFKSIIVSIVGSEYIIEPTTTPCFDEKKITHFIK